MTDSPAPTPGSIDAGADPTLRLLSVPECCALLGVSRWQVYQLINSKQLPSTHLGRRRVVRATDLAAFLDTLTKQGA